MRFHPGYQADLHAVVPGVLGPDGTAPSRRPEVRGTSGSRSFATSSTCSPGSGRGPRLVKPIGWTGGRTVAVSSLCRCGILTTDPGVGRGALSDTMSERTAWTGAEPEPASGPRVPATMRPRVGVILAAGRSERLARVTGGGSKALVRVGGLALVGRAVRTLLGAGLRRVVVVVGYQAGPVAAVVDRLAPGRVRAVFAERWELGNGASLAGAEPLVAGEGLFVLVTADHLFGEGALDPLLLAGRPGVLVDHEPDPDAWAEGMRVRLHDEQVVAFSKELGDPSIDCGAFLRPVAVFDAQRRAAARLRRSLPKEADGPVSRYLNRPLSTRMSMALAHLPLHPDVVSLVAFLL